jgi:hypothetical protein
MTTNQRTLCLQLTPSLSSNIFLYIGECPVPTANKISFKANSDWVFQTSHYKIGNCANDKISNFSVRFDNTDIVLSPTDYECFTEALPLSNVCREDLGRLICTGYLYGEYSYPSILIDGLNITNYFSYAVWSDLEAYFE